MHPTSPPEFRHSSFRGQVGIERADITPPLGIYCRNWGAAKHDVADSIHRPLTVTALTLTSKSDAEPLVLIDADLGWWKTPATFHDFQASLLQALSLPPAKLIVALSHTHSGPPLMEPDPCLPGNELLRRWMQQLSETMVHTVRSALQGQVNATLQWQTGRCGLAANRDLPDPDPNNDRILCGYNPNAEPDDVLVVGRVTDSSEQVIATLVNYACHPTTLAWDNTAISPDYVGAMRETIQAATGAPAMFLLGACGDLAPRYQYVADTAVADRHGRQLGFAALASLSNMEPAGTELAYVGTVESGAPLAVWKPTRHQAPLESARCGPRSNWL